MNRSYTRENFNADLKELANLIKGFKKSGGAAKKKVTKKSKAKTVKRKIIIKKPKTTQKKTPKKTTAKKKTPKKTSAQRKKKSDNKRNFTVVEVNGRATRFGTYKSVSAQGAANKAVTKICKKKKISKDKCKITFSIQETTQGSMKKIYGPYKASLKKQPKSKWVFQKSWNSWVGKYKTTCKLISKK